MKKFLLTVLASCLCLCTFSLPTAGGIKASAAISTKVGMIVTNPAEECSTSMNIGFHAELGTTNCYVQYALKSDTHWENARCQSGTYKTYGADAATNPFYGKSSKDKTGADYVQEHTFLDYSVTLTELTPNTEYKYRVFDGESYSNTNYFKTAGTDEWSFVVTGDFHEYYDRYSTDRAGNANKSIRAATDLAKQLEQPAVEHIVSVGDIVAWGVAYNQWQLVYNQPFIRQYSFANCIGNHDAMDRASVHISDYNSIVANHPQNGYGDQMGTCFYYVYNQVLFIYINYMDTSAEAEEWATKVVDSMAGKYRYSVLVNHRPATSKYNGNTYSYFWNYWSDFCDLHKIDLVLAGDHHVYMRTHALKNGTVVADYGADKPDGTVYIAADSADGERGSSTDVVSEWSEIVASTYFRYRYSGSTRDITSMLVSVNNEKLTVRFVYYENSGAAESSSDFYEGDISGHSSYHYGDTSYVYPSDHSTPMGDQGQQDPSTPSDGDLYTVVFKDEGGNVLSEQKVDGGMSAIPPSVPVKENLIFLGWDKDFNNIQADTVITAVYTKAELSVSFVDWDGTVISSQTVKFGGKATEPTAPERRGYAFTGWDTDFSCVTEDLVITALYEQIATIGDVNGDGAADSADAAAVLQYDLGLIEDTEGDIQNGDVDGNGTVDSADASLILRYDLGLIDSLGE